MFLFYSATEYFSLSPAEFSIDKSIFIKPKTFHLTVLMLKLWNKDRIAKASDVLQVLPFLEDTVLLTDNSKEFNSLPCQCSHYLPR
jgi:hypothetical protein